MNSINRCEANTDGYLPVTWVGCIGSMLPESAPFDDDSDRCGADGVPELHIGQLTFHLCAEHHAFNTWRFEASVLNIEKCLLSSPDLPSVITARAT